MDLLVALITYGIMTFGLTYIVSRAEITEPLRVRIVAKLPVLALLFACRACLSFWTGQAAAAAVMGISCGLGSELPWHAWLYLPPAAGVAAIGLIDIIAFRRGGD